MTDTRHADVGRVYGIVSFGTVFIGLVGLTMKFQTEIIEPIVLVGALIVGFISLYWLFGGYEAYDRRLKRKCAFADALFTC